MAAKCFIFGKLPAHGDFVSRGLGSAERDRLDHWLSSSLVDARAALNARFDDAFDHAQPWRFAHQNSDGWTAGAMAPSVDGVGRRYPLLVARHGVGGADVAAATASAEAAIYDALADGWSVDALVDAVSAASGRTDEVWTSPPGWWTVDARGAVVARVEGEMPADLIRRVLTFGA